MKKKPNNSYNAAALLLGISVERLDKLLDAEKELFVALNEKRQIAEMYKKLFDENEKTEKELEQLKQTSK
jgi:hypothetical protein